MITPGRGHNGRFTRTPETAQRDAEAARLRGRGLSYEQIAARLGYAHRAIAQRAVARALAEVVREPAEELLQLELARLDELTRHAWQVMEAEHPLVDRGRVVRGPDGKPLPDHRPVLCAIDTLLKISERRARLLGLDAPSRSRVEVVSESAVDAAIAELEAEMARRYGGEAP